MKKPILVILQAGRMSDEAYKNFKESIVNLDELKAEYHVIVVDGAEYSDTKFYEI